jgi:hypothetical protein
MNRQPALPQQPTAGGIHMDRIEEKKGFFTRVAKWWRNLFTPEKSSRKRGMLRKNTQPMVARFRAQLERAKATVMRMNGRLVDAARSVGRRVQSLMRWMAPRLLSALRAIARQLEPIAMLFGIVFVAITGSMFVTHLVVYLAGFMGEALAATVSFISTYYAVTYATAVLNRGSQSRPELSEDRSGAVDMELQRDMLTAELA